MTNVILLSKLDIINTVTGTWTVVDAAVILESTNSLGSIFEPSLDLPKSLESQLIEPPMPKPLAALGAVTLCSCRDICTTVARSS